MLQHRDLFSSVFPKVALATAALGSFLFFAGAPSAQAAQPDSCQRRIARMDWRIHEAIEDNGYYSQQANYWRQERREAYDRCYGDQYQSRYERRYYRDRDGNDREYYGDGARDRTYRDHDRDRNYRERDRDRD